MSDLPDGAIPLHRAAMILLDEFWASPISRRPGSYLPPGRPLIEIDDQEPCTDNPLWEIVRRWPTCQLTRRPYYPVRVPKLPELECIQVQLAPLYAHGVVTPGDLTWMADLLKTTGITSVTEVGAGTGYWAWQLEQTGIPVKASDLYPPTTLYGTVALQDAAETAAAAADSALLLVWPPFDSPMAGQALAAYPGDLVLYCGEGQGGASGDDTFFDQLADAWAPVNASPAHVTFTGRHDTTIRAYRRRQATQ